MHTDQVRLAFTTPARPALLLPVVDPDKDPEKGPDKGRATGDYRYLVMPARLPG
jgi:DNA polymerase-3 subunit beta